MTYDTIAECVKKCQYAVRGEIYLAATERIKAGKEVIFTNVGNPHGLGQKPLTFLRQVRGASEEPWQTWSGAWRWYWLFGLDGFMIAGSRPDRHETKSRACPGGDDTR